MAKAKLTYVRLENGDFLQLFMLTAELNDEQTHTDTVHVCVAVTSPLDF